MPKISTEIHSIQHLAPVISKKFIFEIKSIENLRLALKSLFKKVEYVRRILNVKKEGLYSTHKVAFNLSVTVFIHQKAFNLTQVHF